MSRRHQLQQMLQDSPDDTFLLYALAMEQRSAGDDEAALSQLDRVLAVDSDYVAAYFQKGQILAGLDRAEPARQILQQGIAVAGRVGDDHAAAEMTEFLASIE
jgi:Flp pilus assembly protein TadD